MICVISKRLRAYWAFIASTLGLEVVDDPTLADVVVVECTVVEERHPTRKGFRIATVRPEVIVDRFPASCVVIGTHVSGDPWLEGAVMEMGSWCSFHASMQRNIEMPPRIELEVPVCCLLADKDEVDSQRVEGSKSSEHLGTHQSLLVDPQSVLLGLLRREREEIENRIATQQQKLALIDARISTIKLDSPDR